ncbi:MAG TPA: CoA pyrophosphatase [Candidatus Limnocylindrales bacterium]|nr:CoA pyrophosphatase [Candidatus Limnocylindrales bacterium]
MFAHKISSALISRTPEIIRGDGLKPAAVLIPIQERADGDYVVLTKRGDDMPTHKGQIAFPGGRVHVGDADLIATALRESQEEIGVDPEHVRVLGRLDEFTAGYGIVVTPVVGVIPSQYDFRLDPAETSAVASVPIRSLMAPGTYVKNAHLSPGGHPSYHFYINNGWDVWGVTARILVQFLELAYGFETEKK